MSRNIVVSIIAPAFNAEKCIDDFIDSVLKQEYCDWELIIVDDSSSDNTQQILSEYAKKDERIRFVIRDRNPKGSLTCRNIGQLLSKGKYFIHLDSDDILTPCALKQRVEYMENNPTVDFATFRGASVLIDSEKNITFNGRKWGCKPDGDTEEAFLKVEYPFSVWNNIYRKSVFENYLWDEQVKIYTDFSYIIPSLLAGYNHSFAEDSEIDYLYRVGQKNAMTSNFISDDKYDSTKYLFEKTMKQIQKTQKASLYAKSFEKFFLLQAQRVLIDGSELQIKDYIQFYAKWYDGSSVKKVKIVEKLSKNRGNKRSSKVVHLWYHLLFNPAYLFKWITNHN